MGTVKSHREGDKVSARRVEARGQKGRDQGVGSWGGAPSPPLHQLGCLGSAVGWAPSAGSGTEPQKIGNLMQLGTSKVTAGTLYNVLIIPGTGDW